MLEFARYLGCSVVALAVDASLYALGLRLGLAWAVAACIGFCAGLATAYVLSVRFAFKERSVQNARVEFVIFAAAGLVGLALTELLLWLQIGVIGTSPLIAKVGAAGGVFMFNFLARKALLFSRHVRPLRAAA
ncbi:MAG: GtrA family protein [Betaproteobacteria bacterium]